MASIKDQMAAIGGQIRVLRTSNSTDTSQLESLQAQLKQLKVAQAQADKDAASNKITVKVPKGTKDHLPYEMALRNQIFKTITDVFQLHGAVTIDTPVFELKEILAGKYGEDSKLIYDLKDQGGEICSLRYDLTVPFARFLAMNGSTYQNIKRYHIAKVYRRDNPAMTKGRMREFYQCDFDIAGTYDSMIPDAEVVCITCQVLLSLKIDDFTLKLNHRKILDGIFEVCGVPADKIRTISSAVDKLDKLPWAEVKKEMVNDKGLSPEVADKIGEYVQLKGGEDLLAKLEQDASLTANKSAKQGIVDLKLLFSYLKIYGVLQYISFDLSLARGLDYYTGIIYEAVVADSAPPTLAPHAAEPAPSTVGKSKKSSPTSQEEDEDAKVGVGSIAAGGRYDNLVAMFSSSGTQIPCVGISFGVERIYSLLLKKAGGELNAGTGKETECFVMSVGDGLLAERMAVAKELWDGGIKTEFLYKAKPKARPQFDTVDKDQIPIAVIIGGDEVKEGVVRIKVQQGDNEDKDGTRVARSDMVNYIKQKLRR